MSAAAASTARPPAARPPTALDLYRDDGVLARVLRGLGTRIPVAPVLLELVGAAPLAVLVMTEGTRVSTGALAAGVAVFVLFGGLASGRPHSDGLRWAAPPVLRVVEYGTVLYIAAAAGASSRPAGLALVCALVFRHYDAAYRLRYRGHTPPAWVDRLTLGWDGRLIVGCVLLAAGALPAGYFAFAVLLAALVVGESIASWRHFERAQQSALHDDEEDLAE